MGQHVALQARALAHQDQHVEGGETLRQFVLGDGLREELDLHLVTERPPVGVVAGTALVVVEDGDASVRGS